MSGRVESHGVSVGGKPVLAHRERLYADFAENFPEGTRFLLTIEQVTRTLAQNRRLWRLNNNIGLQAGMSKEEVHAVSVLALNQKHATYLDKTSGELVDIMFGGSTHDMNITAMADYQERLIRYWAMHGYDALSGERPTENQKPARPD